MTRQSKYKQTPIQREKMLENAREYSREYYYKNREQMLLKEECEYCCKLVCRHHMREHHRTVFCQQMRAMAEEEAETIALLATADTPQ